MISPYSIELHKLEIYLMQLCIAHYIGNDKVMLGKMFMLGLQDNNF